MRSSSDPVPLSEAIRQKMIAQKSSNTTPELLLRKALHAKGYRYRLGMKVPGAPRRTIDIAFPRQRIAVMVDGCFWHGCQEHAVPPKHNSTWWSDKLARNRSRDTETNLILQEAGWTVLRVWEHEPLEEALRRVVPILEESAERRSTSDEA